MELDVCVCVCDDCDDLSTRMRCRKSHVTSHLFPSDRPACTIGRNQANFSPSHRSAAVDIIHAQKMGQAAQASHSAVLILFYYLDYLFTSGWIIPAVDFLFLLGIHQNGLVGGKTGRYGQIREYDFESHPPRRWHIATYYS